MYKNKEYDYQVEDNQYNIRKSKRVKQSNKTKIKKIKNKYQ